jgi:hypothetical protein
MRSTVVTGPFAEEVGDLVAANWGAAGIRRWLQMRYGDNPALLAQIPSIDSVQRYVKSHAPRGAALIPASILHDLVGNTSVAVDVLGYLEALVPLLGNRLGEALKLEQNLGGMLTDSVDRATSTFLQAARQLWECGQDTGLYPSKPIAPSLLLGSNVTTGDSNLSGDEQRVMWEAIYKHRHGEDLPWIESPLAKEAREKAEADGA